MAKREGYSSLLKFHNILYSTKQECPYKKNLHQLKTKSFRAKIHEPDFNSV